MFDKSYATGLVKMYAMEMMIPSTKITLIHYQTLSKREAITKIDNNFSVLSIQGLPLLFLDKHDEFANKNEEFTTLQIDSFSNN